MAKFDKATAEAEAKKAESLNFTPSAEDKLDGFEQIDGSTMAVPFVRILQSLSPQVKKQEPTYVEGAEEGLWFNTITRELYGNSIRAIVLRFERMYIEWLPERGGFVGAMDPEIAEQKAADKTFGKWKTEEGNSLQETYVYMLLVEGHEKEGPMVLSLTSSAIKVARQWNRMLMTHVMPNGERAMPYYLIWRLDADYQKNDKGTWYNPKMTFDGYVTEQLLLSARTERKVLPARRVDYKQLEAQAAETPAAEEPATY